MEPDRTWRRGLRDAAPVVLVLALCPLIAALAPEPAGPLARIQDLVGVERSLGLFFEPSLHGWVAARPALLGVADSAYAGIHLPVMLGVLAWVWLARPGAFRLVRNTFVAAQALLSLGYVLTPTAPPRMLPGLGYGSAADAGASGLERLAMSPYAAMPSGHAAFAVMAAGIVVALTRRPLVRLVALLYPPLVLLEIFATGNHIWLDAVAGVSAAALGFGLARTLELRSRPELQPQPA